MEKLTVNQLMLLLDQYRGTITQIEMGTRTEDLEKLFTLGLIDLKLKVTDRGEKYLEHIQSLVSYFSRHGEPSKESKEALKYVLDCLKGFNDSLKKAGF